MARIGGTQRIGDMPRMGDTLRSAGPVPGGALRGAKELVVGPTSQSAGFRAALAQTDVQTR